MFQRFFTLLQNKKIHKFFDESYDSFLDLPEDEPEAAFHSSTSRTLASTKRTTAPKYQEEEEKEEEEEEVHNSVSNQETKENSNYSSSSDLVQGSKKDSKGMKQFAKCHICHLLQVFIFS